MQWASVEHGKNRRAVEGRVGFTHRDARRNRRAGAPKRAIHALPSPPSSLLSTCPIRVHSWFYYSPFRVFRGYECLFFFVSIRVHSWFISTSGDARRNRRAGAPKRANHALPSTLSSLLSTCSIRVHSWFKNVFRVFRVFRGFLSSTSGDARRNRRAGAPKRANHALPSTLSSLLPTLYYP